MPPCGRPFLITGPISSPFSSWRTRTERTRFGPCAPRAVSPWQVEQFCLYSGSPFLAAASSGAGPRPRNSRVPARPPPPRPPRPPLPPCAPRPAAGGASSCARRLDAITDRASAAANRNERLMIEHESPRNHFCSHVVPGFRGSAKLNSAPADEIAMYCRPSTA